MRVEILLRDGVVVEAEGSAQEIADLTAALGRSHQIAEPGAGQTETTADPCPPPAPEPDHVPDGVDPDAAEITASRRQEVRVDRAPQTDFHDEQHLETADLPVEGEATLASVDDAARPVGPPLDLVVRDVASQFRLLADPTRLQILARLAERGHNVGELCEALVGQAQPAVSHHLALLRYGGLVTPSREGKFKLYDLTDQGRTLTEAVGRSGSPDGSGAIARFRQASDPTRLQILVTLSERNRNVGELCSDLGGLSQPAVGHHLALLRNGGLVEARRTGKFSYYSLREDGRDLTRLIVPMMAAKARAETGPEGDTSEAGAFDFSAIPDDRLGGNPPPVGDAGGGDETGPGGAPPAHMLCRRVLLMARELHRRGYERLRVAPGLSPSGLHWRCSIVPVGHALRDQGAMAVDRDGIASRYDSGQGAAFFG